MAVPSVSALATQLNVAFAKYARRWKREKERGEMCVCGISHTRWALVFFLFFYFDHLFLLLLIVGFLLVFVAVILGALLAATFRRAIYLGRRFGLV